MERDLIIIGGGPTGLACAIEAGKLGLSALVLEKGCIVNSIFNYPTNMAFFTTTDLLEIGGIPMTSAAPKPTRLEALEYYRKVAAHFQLDVHQYERAEAVERRGEAFCVKTRSRSGASAYHAAWVVLALGYYDLYNPLGVPGEEQPHVLHYYKEAHPYAGTRVVVIGGKNSAVETALDLFRHGAQVTLVHRHAELGASIKYWVRPDIENRLKAGEIGARLGFEVREILSDAVRVRAIADGREERIAADFVFALIGYHPDFEFMRACGVRFDPATRRPICDPNTFESNVPGLYLGGVVVAGPYTGEIFIENGRFHGGVIAADIVGKKKLLAVGS